MRTRMARTPHAAHGGRRYLARENFKTFAETEGTKKTGLLMLLNQQQRTDEPTPNHNNSRRMLHKFRNWCKTSGGKSSRRAAKLLNFPDFRSLITRQGIGNVCITCPVFIKCLRRYFGEGPSNRTCLSRVCLLFR